MTTRRAILDLVKRRGPLDAPAFAAGLGITGQAVRRHLDGLVAEGLLATSVERRRVGRPVTVYRLTEAGDETFPRTYAALSDAVIEAVATEFGQEAVGTVFERRNETALGRMRPHVDRTSVRTVAESLATMQDDAGYLAESSELADDAALLTEHNCAIARIAREWPQACAAELALFRELAGEDVEIERVQHMATGGRTCTYLLRRLR